MDVTGESTATVAVIAVAVEAALELTVATGSVVLLGTLTAEAVAPVATSGTESVVDPGMTTGVADPPDPATTVG